MKRSFGRKLMAVITVLSMGSVFLSACGGGSSATTAAAVTTAAAAKTETTAAAKAADTTAAAAATTAATSGTKSAITQKDKKDLKIGLMLSGSANDGGWSQMAADASKAVSQKYGCTVNFTESVPSSDYESVMRGYADGGYDIIVSHGAEFLDTAKLVAKDYPNCWFICTSAQSGQEPNLSGVDFATEQLGFLNGVACAMATKSKKIGAVGSNKIDSIIAWQKGVEEGAKYVDPSCTVTTVYTGSYDDALKAKQAVTALSEQGCDTFTQNADACGAGAVQACDEMGFKDVGAVSDQTTLGKSCFISVIQDAQFGIQEAIEEALNGKLAAGAVSMGAKEGVISLSQYSGDYKDILTADQKAKLQEVYDKAKSGEDISKLAK